MSMVLGFGEFKSKEDYWKDSKVQNSFQIVTALKLKCALTKHTTTLKKSANFQLGQYQRSQTGTSLLEKT
jgi:hypothetical protein